MTSNLGSRVIHEARQNNLSDEDMEAKVEDLLKAQFKPEFINRVDEFVLFHSLSEEHLLQIIDLLLDEVKRLVHAQGMSLDVTDGAKKYLADAGFDPEYGARPLRRVIQTELETPLSQELIKEAFSAGDTIKVSLATNKKELVFSKAS